ncbi:DUF4333 domain-containing protein [Nocardioides pantholopis]|uniref:DUF4333 domain-containing protein n=1 Tax=Nocardioides pantholopis TaxID=2483798 RepID=UPI0019D1627C|nr:DUF4333 domain-containing protein [Nocardioides pantholopis]
MRRSACVPLALLAPLGLGGLGACSASVSTTPAAVSEEQVERRATTELTRTIGTAPDDIDCPGDLEAEKGTTMRCVLTAGTDRLGVTVTVTRVDGEDVRFDIEVDEEMMP